MEKSQVLGSRELQRVLKQLPDDLQTNALASAGRAGAKELRRVGYAHLAVAMRKRSPREDDIVVQRRRNRTGKPVVMFDVGPPKRKPELRWLHDGTEPHLISADSKYGTRRGARNVAYGSREGSFLTDLAIVFGKTIRHPGQRSRPWLKSATFSSKDGVMRAMATALRKAIPRQVRRLVSKEYRDRRIRRFLR